MSRRDPIVMLADTWCGEDPSGWHVSEKLDGVRVLWDGRRMLSRTGLTYAAPDWFTRALPRTHLDGELWAGRGNDRRDFVSGVARRHHPRDHDWRQIAYAVFDAPKARGGFAARLATAADAVTRADASHVMLLPHEHVRSRADLDKRLRRVVKQGGEGLIIRRPGSRWDVCRSLDMLKVKPRHDAEARVTGHTEGKGRCRGMLGALRCETMGGVAFKIGTGLSDRQRERPPAIGSVVTFSYQQLTKRGVPREPALLGVRHE